MLRRVRSVADPSGAGPAPPAPPAGRRRATRPPRPGVAPADGDLDDAIFAVVEAAEPAVGRTRAVEILLRRALEGRREYSYDGLPTYGTFAHLRRDDVLARVDELLAGGRLRLRPAGASRTAGARRDAARSASASWPRARARTSRRSSTRVHGGGRDRVVARRVRQARRARRSSGARQRGRRRRATFPLGDFADRAARDAALADWLAGHDVRLVVLAGYMQLLDAGASSALPARGVNVHPALLPAFPGSSGRAGARRTA